MPRRAPAHDSAWLRAALIGGAFLVFVWLEAHRPLRLGGQTKLRRNARNLALFVLSATAIRATETPVLEPLSAWVERRRFGLLQLRRLPRWLEMALALALMDYTLYLWHVLVHRVPLLWRFHQVHHVDLDMDASTAVRFHFGEMVLSVPWRAAQVALLGVRPSALSAWQTALTISIFFHHSNMRLPAGLERGLGRLVVTPRMHGIHHSTVREEQDSNWSSGLTLWDALHGTLRRDVPQRQIVIGVPAWQDPQELTLPKLLAMPLVEQREAWELPGGGRPVRERSLSRAQKEPDVGRPRGSNQPLPPAGAVQCRQW